MEDDRQTDEQTDGEWVRVLDVTNGRAGQARGRETRLYSPGDAGLILTYALEWNEDWHDLLIWAVTAHDGHGRSPVTPLQARRTSCHQDRSKIEIHFLLGVDSNRATGLDFHLSLHLPPLYLLGSCRSSYRYKIIQYRTCFCLLLFFYSVLFQARGNMLWGGGKSMFFHWFRECCSPVPDFHYVKKKGCFDTSSNAIFLIGDSSKRTQTRVGGLHAQCAASITHFWQMEKRHLWLSYKVSKQESVFCQAVSSVGDVACVY